MMIFLLKLGIFQPAECQVTNPGTFTYINPLDDYGRRTFLLHSSYKQPRHGDCATEGATEGAQDAAIDMVSKALPGDPFRKTNGWTGKIQDFRRGTSPQKSMGRIHGTGFYILPIN